MNTAESVRELVGLHSAALPKYLQNLKRVAMGTFTPRSLASRVKTGTYQASESPFADDPESGARGLEYGEGHSAPSASERKAVVDAARWLGTVGSVNDASHQGPYGIYVEARDKDHERAHRALPDALATAAMAAWEDARAT